MFKCICAGDYPEGLKIYIQPKISGSQMFETLSGDFS